MAALDLLGRRWTLRILWELRDGPLGFRALQQRCDGMSSSVLRDRLRDLTEARVISGEEAGGYGLSPLGTELLSALDPLWRWTARWEEELGGGDGGGRG